MIKLAYTINKEDLESELEWLAYQKIMPSQDQVYDWEKEKIVIWVGMIVPDEIAMMVKLRHPLRVQAEYKQR